jgi:hypothetical protein
MTGWASEDFLEPYNLQPDDRHWVIMVAWGTQCVDCGYRRDYYVVFDHVWKDAGLEPDQYCCRKCLAVRLGRPLKRGDFTDCPLNTSMDRAGKLVEFQ